MHSFVSSLTLPFRCAQGQNDGKGDFAADSAKGG